MAKWDYLVIERHGGHAADFERRLCDLGGEGWELIAVAIQNHSTHVAYLKRVRS